MRVSTVTMFDQSVSAMNRQQSEFLRVGQEIASGRKVTKPSDNPQIASQEVGLNQSKAVNSQYADARVGARNALSQQESILGSVSDSLQRARTLMIQASSDVLSDADRDSVASELEGILEMVLGQANATDGNGRYLFGGHRDSSTPFQRGNDGRIEYLGDDSPREVFIDSSRKIPVTDSGASIFMAAPQQGGYGAEANDDNGGTLVVSQPRTRDINHPDRGDSFEIEFAAEGPNGFDYTINGAAAGTYQPGDVLEFGGLSLELDGEPAVGDSITVAPTNELNTNIFATLENTIAALEAPVESDADQARLRNTLGAAFREVDSSFDNVLTRRASVGARLNEVDLLDRVGETRMLNYEQALSSLVDLDYAEAVSEYSLRQIGLQAAQKAFADIQGLSLFKFI